MQRRMGNFTGLLPWRGILFLWALHALLIPPALADYYDGHWVGWGNSEVPYNDNYEECPITFGLEIEIQRGRVTGTMETDWTTLPLTGQVRGSEIEMSHGAIQFVGWLECEEGDGDWSEPAGCYGFWSLERETFVDPVELTFVAPGTHFSVGDTFYLRLEIDNPYEHTWNADLYVILQAGGSCFSYPFWRPLAEGVDSCRFELAPGERDWMVVKPFLILLPGSGVPCVFYGAIFEAGKLDEDSLLSEVAIYGCSFE